MPEYKFQTVVAFLNTLYSYIYIADFEGGKQLINTINWNDMLPREDISYMQQKLNSAERLYKGWFSFAFSEPIKAWQNYLNEEAKPF